MNKKTNQKEFFILIISCSATLATYAQEYNKQAAQALAPVVVKLNASEALQSSSTSSVLIVNRNEFEAYGDSLPGILNRVPGISVVSKSGNTKDIKMFGLGGGYVEFQLNGDAVPAYFDLNSINPEMIERIEVRKQSTTGSSSSAIAGVINIVLRKQASKFEYYIKPSISKRANGSSTSIEGRISDSFDSFKYGLTASLSNEPSESKYKTIYSLTSPVANESGFVDTTEVTNEKMSTLTLGPSFGYQLNDDNSINYSGLLRFRRIDSINIKNFMAEPAGFLHLPFARIDNPFTWHTNIYNSKLTHKLNLGNESQVVNSITYNYIARQINSEKSSRSGDYIQVDSSYENKNLEEQLLIVSSNISKKIFNDSSLTFGAIYQKQSIKESYFFESFSPSVLRSNQHSDVSITTVHTSIDGRRDKYLSYELGLKAINFRSTTSDTLVNMSLVNPSIQIMLRPTGGDNQSIRAELSRAVKFPKPSELLERVKYSDINTPVTPDINGNPSLMPEIAVKIDLGYHKKFDNVGSVNFGVRHTKVNNTRSTATLNTNNRWMTSPINLGDATIDSSYAEVKWNVASFCSICSGFSLAANTTLNRTQSLNQSEFSGVQDLTPKSHGLSLNYDNNVLSYGLSINWSKASVSMPSSKATKVSADGKSMDIFAKYKISKKTTVNLSATSLLSEDAISTNSYSENFLEHRYSDQVQRPWSLTLSMEHKF